MELLHSGLTNKLSSRQHAVCVLYGVCSRRHPLRLQWATSHYNPINWLVEATGPELLESCSEVQNKRYDNKTKGKTARFCRPALRVHMCTYDVYTQYSQNYSKRATKHYLVLFQRSRDRCHRGTTSKCRVENERRIYDTNSFFGRSSNDQLVAHTGHQKNTNRLSRLVVFFVTSSTNLLASSAYVKQRTVLSFSEPVGVHIKPTRFPNMKEKFAVLPFSISIVHIFF
jgi:hypothetical protein